MTQETGLGQKPAKVDHSRRQVLQRLAVGAAFVAPVVTSVSMDAMTISKAHAATASSSAMNGKDECREYYRKTMYRRQECSTWAEEQKKEIEQCPMPKPKKPPHCGHGGYSGGA